MPTVITGSGSYIPEVIKTNVDFSTRVFYDETGQPIRRSQDEIINRFRQITGIEERRYADTSMSTSQMAAIASGRAIEQAGIDAETIDQIIVAHNFGDLRHGSAQSELVPSLASRVKHQLGIRNARCVAYDILFGCPGWLQGLIQADLFTKAGAARNCLVIGAETLSRISDPHDRDSMIYSDGAGAVVTQWQEDSHAGIIGTLSASYALDDLSYITMGKSKCTQKQTDDYYLTMQGRKVYEFALTNVPAAIKTCLEETGIPITDVKKIFIHQANQKMNEAIIERLFRLYDMQEVPADIMPMNIQMHGNSSVATIPTLFDMVTRGVFPQHSLHTDDVIVMASVGAGMNINAVCYRC